MFNERINSLILWFSFILTTILYLFLILNLQPKKAYNFDSKTFLIIGAVIALIPHLYKYFISFKVLPFGLLLSISEIPSILGLILYFTTADKENSIKLCIISFFSILFLFPKGNEKKRI